jgi:hypothetical protein
MGWSLRGLGALCALIVQFVATAEEPARPAAPPLVREIFVPFSELPVVLEAAPQRVFLPRAEYEQLLQAAKQTALTAAPRTASIIAADYRVEMAEERARIRGTLTLEVLEPGVHALTLEWSGVGVRSARLDGQPAPLAQVNPHQVVLFVDRVGRQQLELELVAAVETTAALQSLSAKLPQVPSTRWQLTVPGNVEIKSGAAVRQREFDANTQITRFELLPNRGAEPLVMTLNNRQLQRDRVVLARSVLIDELTQGYERLHATMTFTVLHGAVERLRWEVPAGFEVTEVKTPLLARWSLLPAAGDKAAGDKAAGDKAAGDKAAGDKAAVAEPGNPAAAQPGVPAILELMLREPATSAEPVTVQLIASRLGRPAPQWTFPELKLLDTSSHVAVLGLLTEPKWDVDAVRSEGLLPIDAGHLWQALPTSVQAAEPGAPLVRTVAAFYAPQADYRWSARLREQVAAVRATGNLLLNVGKKSWEVRGGFALVPEVDKVFRFDMEIPAGWVLLQVSTEAGANLAFEEYAGEQGTRQIHVRLPAGLRPQVASSIYFRAEATPEGWLDTWPEKKFVVPFPRFLVRGATQFDGAIAIHSDQDFKLEPAAAERFRAVTPLDENEKKQYGLAGTPTAFAYRHESSDYTAEFTVEPVSPVITARTFSFLKYDADSLTAHYELVLKAERGRAQEFTFLLPRATPKTLQVSGLDGIEVKEFSIVDDEVTLSDDGAPAAPPTKTDSVEVTTEKTSSQEESQDSKRSSIAAVGWRRWRVVLGDYVQGQVRLRIDFEQRLPESQPKGLVLPLLRADPRAVVYESGLMAVETAGEVDAQLNVELEGRSRVRKIDKGELAEADHEVGKRMLGAFGFLGLPPTGTIDLERRQSLRLASTIVQRAELVTLVGASGRAITAARFTLRTKSSFLELGMPEQAKLWSAMLNQSPLAPQREGERLLLSLPMVAAATLRDVQLVYESPVEPLSFRGTVAAQAPRLWLRESADEAPQEVPLADVQWRVLLPTGYQVTSATGTVFPNWDDPETRQNLQLHPAPWTTLANRVERASDWTIAGTQRVTGVMNRALAMGGGMAPAARKAYEVLDSKHSESMTANASPSWNKDSAGMAELEVKRRVMEQMNAGRVASGVPPASMAPGMAAPAPAASERTIDSRLAKEERPRDQFDESGRRDPAASAKDQAIDSPRSQPADKSDDRRSDAAPTTKQPSPQEPTPSDLLAEVDRAKTESDDVSGLGREDESLGLWALQGVRSLPIDLLTVINQTPHSPLKFQSLGNDPTLQIAIIPRVRWQMLAWSLAVVWGGLFWKCVLGRSASRQIRWLICGWLVAGILPLIGVWHYELSTLADPLFSVNSLLAFGCVIRGAWRELQTRLSVRRRATLTASTTSALSLLLAVGLLIVSGSAVQAQPTTPTPMSTPMSTPTLPVVVPDDAIILPYDPKAEQPTQDAKKVFIPYAKYIELWNLAHPDQRTLVKPLPATYAWGEGRYSALLEASDDLLLEGHFTVKVFAAEPLDVPLPLTGGVFVSATVGGRPAVLRMVVPPNTPPQLGVITLSLPGKGVHEVALQVRMKLQRRGGWRVAEGRLPNGLTTALNLRVAAAGTEVRVGDVMDRSRYETTQDRQPIETALGSDGKLNLAWRPRVSTGEVDRGLSVESNAEWDVRDDTLRLVWQLQLQFPRGRRDSFTLEVPRDYLVERVVGDNVRGWNSSRVADEAAAEMDAKAAAPAKTQTVNVTLLKQAVDQEKLTLVLSRRGRVGLGDLTSAAVPVVMVSDAVLHQGVIAIRRSVNLDVHLEGIQGLTPAERAAQSLSQVAGVVEESPLAVRPLQTLRFKNPGYAARLVATIARGEVSAEFRSLLKIEERRSVWESQVILNLGEKLIHQLRVRLPAGLTQVEVSGPVPLRWTMAAEETQPPTKRQLLTILLPDAVKGAAKFVIRGRLERVAGADMPLPQVELLDVTRQTGLVVVQVDPAVEVRAVQLQGCESVLLSQANAWLAEGQRAAARLALAHRSAEFAGSLQLVRREPRVACHTITNVNVSSRTIQETILLEFRIEEAGVRELEFELPAALREAQISAPLLRRKVISDRPAGIVQVKLELQDEVMGEYRVLVQQDRLVSGDVQVATVPRVLTGRTDQRLVAFESSARDELVVESGEQFEALTRQQQAWARLSTLLGDKVIAAYQVRGEATQVQLPYRLRTRNTVETVQARIALAQTELEVDESGTYRGRQTYQVDNGTEQHLEVELPEGATIWTVQVAGDAVRPQAATGGKRRVLIPLVKTAQGDLDYPVVITYAGQLTKPGWFRQVSFPFLKTVNINVELSRVRLLLPAGQRWFNFSGSLGEVGDRGEYEASGLEYQIKRLTRLSDLLRSSSGDDLLKLRASGNLKQLDAQVQQQLTQNYQNDAYSRNSTRLRSALEQSRSQVEQEELAQSQLEQKQVENRERLNGAFLKQFNQRANNVVTELGDNFSAEAARPAENTVNPEGFNGNWFATNGLTTKVSEGRVARVRTESGGRAAGRKGSGEEQQLSQLANQRALGAEQKPAADAKANAQPDGAENEQVKLNRRYQQRLDSQKQSQSFQESLNPTNSFFFRNQTAPGAGGQLPGSAAPGATNLGDVANAPQRSAANAAQGGMGPGNAGPASGSLGRPTGGPMGGGFGGGGMGVGGMGMGMGGGMGSGERSGALGGGGGMNDTGGQLGAEFGEGYLAGVPVDLPGRGREYLFRTPRADLELTARSLDQPLLERGYRLLAILGVIALLVVARRITSTGNQLSRGSAC